MVNGGHDQISQKFLQIKEDDKFFSRLLSKEGSKAEASFRVLYYGGSSGAAVPFMWESQPGTPKNPLSHSSLPPLTPPPSYQSNKSMQKKKKYKDKITPRFVATIFASKTCHVSPSLWPSSSTSTSSSSSSGSLSVSSPSTRSSSWLSKSRSSSWLSKTSRSSTLHFGDDDGSSVSAPSSPTMCFGARGCGLPKGRSCRSEPNVKSCTV